MAKARQGGAGELEWAFGAIAASAVILVVVLPLGLLYALGKFIIFLNNRRRR